MLEFAPPQDVPRESLVPSWKQTVLVAEGRKGYFGRVE